MIEWSNEDKMTLYTALYGWVLEENKFIDNVKSSKSLSENEKSMLLSNSVKKIENIQIVIEKVNSL